MYSKIDQVSQGIEPMHDFQNHVVCWRSVFAGVLVSIMGFMILVAFGAGAIGVAAQNAIQNERSGGYLASPSGWWLGLSAVISLFLGSYFAARISKAVTNKVGAAHAFVVASLFFILTAVTAGTTIGSMTQGFSQLVKGWGQGAVEIVTSATVQDTINSSLAEGTFKSEAKTVAEGLTIRLLAGNIESAKAYYSYQTGLSLQEVNAKVLQLRNEFETAAKLAAEKASLGFSKIGWMLFSTFVFGLLSALFGGRIGAQANISRPLVREQVPLSLAKTALT